MKVNFKGELRTVGANEYVSRNTGEKGVSYRMLVECGTDSLQFPTTKEVYEQYQDGYLYKGLECEFTADYNPQFQFNNFVVKEATAC